jgi:hypothetical protein
MHLQSVRTQESPTHQEWSSVEYAATALLLRRTTAPFHAQPVVLPVCDDRWRLSPPFSKTMAETATCLEGLP